MFSRPHVFVAFMAMSVSVSQAFAGLFSIDPASPANVIGTITPDDVLANGPVVVIEGSALGQADDIAVFDNLNALSFGSDPMQNPVFFSVDRLTSGVLGSAVASESSPGAEAQGDVFQAIPPLATNLLVIDEQSLGLTPGFFGDDLDALGSVMGTTASAASTYFSIDALSANNGFGAGTMANDIFLTGLSPFASGETHIGLDPFDDLDALALLDRGTIGSLDPGVDQALFSLSTFSPSTFTFTGNLYIPGVAGFLSPADILFTDFSGGFSLWSSAADIGLAAEDELNALTTGVVPEPASIATWALLGLGGIACRRRRPVGVEASESASR